MIVCIPTKGRPKTQTYKIFEEAGYKVFHFIEPQEWNLYDVPNKVNIIKNNQGLAYVRNFIVDWAKENSHDWVWISDDDISGFGYYNGKTVKTGAEILKKIEDKAFQLPFELVGMNYCQYAWTEKQEYSINSKWVDCCVLLNCSKIHWKFRGQIKVDRDFELQTIQNGHGALRFNKIWFNCPPVGTNKGGLHEIYAAKKDHDGAKTMVFRWAPWAKLFDKNGRLDVKVDIKAFAKSCGRKVK